MTSCNTSETFPLRRSWTLSNTLIKGVTFAKTRRVSISDWSFLHGHSMERFRITQSSLFISCSFSISNSFWMNKSRLWQSVLSSRSSMMTKFKVSYSLFSSNQFIFACWIPNDLAQNRLSASCVSRSQTIWSIHVMKIIVSAVTVIVSWNTLSTNSNNTLCHHVRYVDSHLSMNDSKMSRWLTKSFV